MWYIHNIIVGCMWVTLKFHVRVVSVCGITSPHLYTHPQPAEDTMSLTIVNFIMEPGSSLTTRAEDTSGYFVEFQLLDYDYGVLETPSVFIPPHSAQPITFNFKTGTCVHNSVLVNDTV